MNVRDTITAMMRTNPGIHANRVQALFHLFEHGAGTWDNGEFVPSGTYSADTPFEPVAVDGEDAALSTARESDVPFRAAALLERRREHAQRLFVYTWAHELAVEGCTELEGRPRFTGRNLDTMPDDVSPDWLNAAKEVARAVLNYSARPGRSAETFDQVAWKETFSSRRAAEQFLERVGAKAIPAAERAARLQSLMREARALGLDLQAVQGTD